MASSLRLVLPPPLLLLFSAEEPAGGEEGEPTAEATGEAEASPEDAELPPWGEEARARCFSALSRARSASLAALARFFVLLEEPRSSFSSVCAAEGEGARALLLDPA